MKQLLLMFTGLVLLSITPHVAAQERVAVTGRVADQAGGPIAGAYVVEKGTQNGTITDGSGVFSLRVEAASTLEVSFLGYVTREVAASEAGLAPVVLQQDVTQISEVVVIGYGTVRKDDMTGSVSVIRSEEINRGSVVSPQEMLKGKMPGLQIIPGDGNPNSGATIRIRGAASLKATNNPLIVIDGVPIAEDAGEGMGNPLTTVNPNDIETMSVLKDASAAAIYGSRASNGVIIITTRKGTGNQIKLSYNGSASVETNSSRLNVMTPSEFRNYIDTRLPAGSSPMADIMHSRIGDANTDWQKLIFRTTLSNDHNFSAYGNIKERMPWRASAGYTNQRGTLKTSLYERGTIDLSVAPNFFDKHLTVSLNAKGSTSFENKPDTGTVGTAAFFNPTIDPYWRNNDGSIDYNTTNGFWNYGSGRGDQFMPNILLGAGPLSKLYDHFDYGYGNRVIGNAQIDYKLHGFEALRFNLNLGLDWSNTRGVVGDRPNSFQSWTDTEARGWGQFSKWSHLKRNKVLEAYVDYNETWGKHHFDAMAGHSWQHFYSSDQDGIRYFNQTGEMNTIAKYPYNRQESYLISFYGRLNYSYDSRYLFTFTLRDDASSRFAKDQRWGLFPSAAFAWNIANEAFMSDARNISALKLRLGAGQTGQQEFDNNYPYLARYDMSTNVYNQYNMGSEGYSFFLSPRPYDPSIRWESTTTYNIGLDFGLFNGRVNGSVDWYNRLTKDLLNEVLTPMGANFGNTLLTNIGSMKNSGLEFAVNVTALQTKDWGLDVGFNGTFQKTRFTRLNATDDPTYDIPVTGVSAGTGGTIARHKVGYAPYTFFPYQQIYDSNGMPIQNALVDRDGDGTITQNDRYMSGKSPSPDFYYGLNLKLTYRQWDFGFNAHGSVGNWAFNDFASNHATSFIDVNAGNLPNFAHTVLDTGWMGQNSSQQPFSDLFIENASFFKLDDINLGYTFDGLFSKRGSARLGFSVQNVFTITPYSGVDPEIPGVEGRDSAIWPRPRTFSLRLNVNF
jgi:iron complex outermembrane receptor protein